MGGKKLARTRFINQVVISQPRFTDVLINHSATGTSNAVGFLDDGRRNRKRRGVDVAVNARYGMLNADFPPLAVRALTVGNMLCYSRKRDAYRLRTMDV